MIWKKRVFTIVTLAVLAVILSGLMASPALGQQPPRVKVLIGFTRQPGSAEQALVRRAGGSIKYVYHLVPAIAATVPETAIEHLMANPSVVRVEPDVQGHAVEIDVELSNSWGVARIGAGVVHEALNKGDGVKIAIIDSGVDYNHPDLDDNFDPSDLGRDFVQGDDYPMDVYGHGTHVAGTACAEDNDNGVDDSTGVFGVVGVAPECALYSLRVLDDRGMGYASQTIAAMQWAVENDMQVANLSIGWDRNPGDIFKDAFDAAWDAGLVIVAAAGNSGTPPGRGNTVIYPAKYESVIAVAAIDNQDQRASFSSTGDEVELAAPGVSVYSTWNDADSYNSPQPVCGTDAQGAYGCYKYGSGTSMASPHVAGTAALIIATNPVYWTNDRVRARLQSTAEDLGALGRDPLYGYGLVDADEAAAPPTDTTPPAKVTGLDVTTFSCAQLELSWDASTEADLHHYNVYRSTTSGDLYDLIASPTTNSYSDSGLTASTAYHYVISAVDNSGNEGEASDEVPWTTDADDLGPVTSGVVADPNPTNGATSVTLAADVSDSTTGNSIIAAAEYFMGPDGPRISMGDSDNTFDSSTERITASIDVSSGWAVGQYTLYVRGQDAEGNWGATESVVLEISEAPSTIMVVDSIVFSYKVAGPNKFLYTTVKVLDGDGDPLGGVGVEMTLTWDGTSAGPWYFAGETALDGTVKFTLLKAPSGLYTATVSDLSLADYTWVPTKDVTPDPYEL